MVGAQHVNCGKEQADCQLDEAKYDLLQMQSPQLLLGQSTRLLGSKVGIEEGA